METILYKMNFTLYSIKLETNIPGPAGCIFDLDSLFLKRLMSLKQASLYRQDDQ